MRRALLIALSLAALPGTAEPAAPIDPALIGAEGAEGRRPRGFVWSEDGARLAFLYDGAGGDAVYVTDVGTGRTAKELEASSLEAGGKRADRIDAVLWSPAGESLLLRAGGDLFLHPLGQSDSRPLTRTRAEEKDPKFSPDGTRIAYVRDGNLFLIDLAEGEERALTRDGRPGAVLNGDTDWVYWEEIWGRDATGFWWSPDGRRIAFYRFDDTAVDAFPIAGVERPYPRVRWQKYPAAGRINPAVRVGVLDLDTGGIVYADTGNRDAYLARVAWEPDGRALDILRLDREQTTLTLLRCDPESGECKPLIEESHPTWVNVEKDFLVLPDGRFVWGSERSGRRRLYLYSRDGNLLHPLTPPDRIVTSLDGFDRGSGEIVYTATGKGELGATVRHVFRVPVDRPVPVAVTDGDGWHRAWPSPRGGHFVHSFSDADHPPRIELIRGDGSAVALPSSPPQFDPDALPRWRFLTIPGPEGLRLPAMLLEPETLEPGSRHPAIMYHYGGPGSQVVARRWSGRGRGLWHKMMAQRGFLVLSVDNAASIHFGKSGEDRIHRRFGEVNLAAQLAGVRFLASLPYADTARIGLWGWSGGGANTLYCLLHRPGVWRAGVAGAPVTDWTLYDTIWTERYLDSPADNEDGYRESSPISHAADLADALLIVHGTADDNVHMLNTLAFVGELVEAGKPFEMAIYPGQKHGFRGAALRHFYARMTEFFERHLAAGR
ncbi:MAG: S9 family peptidase [Acidobacteria bacterium]|nr:MAG: S9 family peptidase [Acidobacteriota bacterium]